MSTSKIDQKKYLQKYLSNDVGDSHKKKKKKKERSLRPVKAAT